MRPRRRECAENLEFLIAHGLWLLYVAFLSCACPRRYGVVNWAVLSSVTPVERKPRRMGCSWWWSRPRGAASQGAAQNQGIKEPGSQVCAAYTGAVHQCVPTPHGGGTLVIGTSCKGMLLWLRFRRLCGIVVRKLFFCRSPLRTAADPRMGRLREGNFRAKKCVNFSGVRRANRQNGVGGWNGHPRSKNLKEYGEQ